jgi:E3 ubiquitin-protein ligase BRE1
VMQLEDFLAQLRKEYEMLRIEFEQNLAANEQTGPINREMRHLITSLQNNTQQLKGEVHRYKRKYKEANTEIPKLKKEVEDLNAKLTQVQGANQDSKENIKKEVIKEEDASTSESGAQVKEEPASTPAVKKEEDESEQTEEGDGDKTSNSGNSPSAKKDAGVKQEKGTVKKEPAVKTEKDHREAQRVKDAKIAESEMVRDLKNQLKKALNEQKEMKLLLDMYKGVSKEQRDKVQLMAAEKKLRTELEDIRQQIKKMQDSKRDDKRKLAEDEALKKIKQLEEQKYELQKQVASQKPSDGNWGGHNVLHQMRPFVGSHEEEALLNEMEVTGQAFEDMQEQNSRLIQQLREKDDANFKLMSERIKSNQLHKLAREEKYVLKEQVRTLTTQVEASNLVVR